MTDDSAALENQPKEKKGLLVAAEAISSLSLDKFLDVDQFWHSNVTAYQVPLLRCLVSCFGSGLGHFLNSQFAEWHAA